MNKKGDTVGATGLPSDPKNCINGKRMMTKGMMKMYINSRRLVKALRSFLITAFSSDENPSFIKIPDLGVYTPLDTVITGGSYNPNITFNLTAI